MNENVRENIKLRGFGVVHKVDTDVTHCQFVPQIHGTLRRIRGRGTEVDVSSIIVGDMRVASGVIDVLDLDLLVLKEIVQPWVPILVEFHGVEHPQRVTILFLIEPLPARY